MLTPERIAFLNTLSPPDPHWKGLGAVELIPDRRDYDIRWIPAVANVLAAGVPDTADLTHLIGNSLYDQGSSPACVAYSTGGLCSMDEVAEGGAWEVFNSRALYLEAGGDDRNGVDSRRVLEIVTTTGIQDNTGRKKVVSSYAFVPQQAGVFRQALKAAIAAGQPCHLALLLPAPFQWNSGDAPTSGYHAVTAVGYDATWVTVLNSWGQGWPGDGPRPGLGRVKWDYLEADSLMHGYVYSYTVTPTEITPPPPPPPPPPPITSALIEATATGPGVGGLRDGDQLRLTSGLLLAVSRVQFDVAPPPPPPELVVSGYRPNPVGSGQPFAIEGKGFSGGNLTVLWQGGSLVAQRETDAQIQAVAPAVANTASGAVTVQVEALHGDGPLLTVTADAGPGQLQVTVAAKRYSRGLLGVWAWVQEPGSAALELDFTALPDQAPSLLSPTVLNPEAGGYVAASLTGQVEGGGVVKVLGTRQTTATGTPAVWQTVNAPPAPATVTVTAVAGGRSGQGTKAL